MFFTKDSLLLVFEKLIELYLVEIEHMTVLDGPDRGQASPTS